ncbi:MAG TPA: CHAD domain-containing protein [Solirubrobacteraceae bacterium]|nr:CHAD domain-containing protein [Solirubrobacteraceae bacterium]
MALGVGVTLARAERERRASGQRRARNRRFALLADERVGEGLRRMALGQLDVTIEVIEGRDGTLSPQKRVHEARKALKRLRALLRLVRDELGEQAYARESAIVREAGGRLARARDAEVLLSTMDGLVKRHPERLGRRRGVQRLRARLQIERDGAAELALSESVARAGTLEDLRALRARAGAWELADAGGIEAIEAALEHLYGTGRRRMRRAARAGGARGRKLHEWRKRVKDLRYAAEMLQRSDHEGAKLLRDRVGAKAGKRARRRANAKTEFIGEVARRADELGELLGEEHDLAVLADRVRSEAKATRASGAPGPGTRRALLGLIAKRRRRLRKRALRKGRSLYARKPNRFVRRMRAAATLGSLSRR